MHFLIICCLLYRNVIILVTQSCLTLCNLTDYGPSGYSVHGILQARILEWVAMAFSKESFWCKDQTHVSYVGRQVLHQLCYLGSPPKCPKDLNRHFFKNIHQWWISIWKDAQQSLGKCILKPQFHTIPLEWLLLEPKPRGLPGGQMVKNLSANAEDTVQSLVQKIPRTTEQLSLCITTSPCTSTTEASMPRAHYPQQEKPLPVATRWKPECSNEDPAQPKLNQINK